MSVCAFGSSMIEPQKVLSWFRSLPFEQEVAGGLLAGALLLLSEIRFEHREVLGETWRSWIPLLWLGTLVAVGGLAWVRWNAGGRKVLSLLFGITAIVGLAGVWFHSGGHLLREGRRVASAWTLAPGKDGGAKTGSAPPVLAPGALVGLGLLGLRASLGKRDVAH